MVPLSVSRRVVPVWHPGECIGCNGCAMKRLAVSIDERCIEHALLLLSLSLTPSLPPASLRRSKSIPRADASAANYHKVSAGHSTALRTQYLSQDTVPITGHGTQRTYFMQRTAAPTTTMPTTTVTTAAPAAAAAAAAACNCSSREAILSPLSLTLQLSPPLS